MTLTAATVRPTVTWDVQVLGRQQGLTDVSRRGDETRLRVGDHDVPGDPQHGAAPRLRSLLVAHLYADGRVHLVTRCAPPALLVGQDRVRLLPEDGSSTSHADLTDGDVLVMCSASALEDDPSGIVGLLAAGPGATRHRRPQEVLHDLLNGSKTGAAAVARYVAA